MPAGLPGDTKANNTGANPSAGQPITFDLISGPKGSLFDKDSTNNASTGALSTGIGFGAESAINLNFASPPRNGYVYGYDGFSNNEQPGITNPSGTVLTNAVLMYIGGGRTATSGSPRYANVAGVAGCTPYTGGFGIGFAGNTGPRDAGAGPVFQGFTGKLVATAVGAAAGAAIAAPYINLSGVALPANTAAFGVSNAAAGVIA